MKKAFTSIAVMTCVLCLAGCGMGPEPEHKITDPLPDKVVVEEEKIEDVIKDDKTAEESTEKLDSQKTEEELQKEYEEWKEGVVEKAEEAKNTESTDNKDNTTTNNDGTTTTSVVTDNNSQPVDPYSGLAVAKCHSVTLPKGVDYNTAISEITKGTSAYPNTFPVIDNVDFNTPGIYTCAWVRKMDDGTYLPLNYAVFTVTITDQTTANIINGEWFEWSISKHSKEVMDLAKQYVHYYGTGEISGALTKEITAPGDYLIKWTSTDGATYNQTVHVVE